MGGWSCCRTAPARPLGSGARACSRADPSVLPGFPPRSRAGSGLPAAWRRPGRGGIEDALAPNLVVLRPLGHARARPGFRGQLPSHCRGSRRGRRAVQSLVALVDVVSHRVLSHFCSRFLGCHVRLLYCLQPLSVFSPAQPFQSRVVSTEPCDVSGLALRRARSSDAQLKVAPLLPAPPPGRKMRASGLRVRGLDPGSGWA